MLGNPWKLERFFLPWCASPLVHDNVRAMAGQKRDITWGIRPAPGRLAFRQGPKVHIQVYLQRSGERGGLLGREHLKTHLVWLEHGFGS